MLGTSWKNMSSKPASGEGGHPSFMREVEAQKLDGNDIDEAIQVSSERLMEIIIGIC